MIHFVCPDATPNCEARQSEDNWDTLFKNTSVNAPYMLADAQCKISSQRVLLMCITTTTEIDNNTLRHYCS